MTRVLIVDDEEPARQIAREYLADVPAVVVVGECSGGREAVRVLTEAHQSGAPIDLAVLDIQMPRLDGFGVLSTLDASGVPLPAVVFSTAYDEHALRAFEVAAVDYLLKPYTRTRFNDALRRALAALGERPPPREMPTRLLVRRGSVLVPVDIADVAWIEADGDYARLHLWPQAGRPAQAHLASLGLSALLDRLDGRFVRIHRSAAVHLDALQTIERDGHGGFVARLTDGAVVRISRTYADAVRDLIV